MYVRACMRSWVQTSATVKIFQLFLHQILSSWAYQVLNEWMDRWPGRDWQLLIFSQSYEELKVLNLQFSYVP